MLVPCSIWAPLEHSPVTIAFFVAINHNYMYGKSQLPTRLETIETNKIGQNLPTISDLVFPERSPYMIDGSGKLLTWGEFARGHMVLKSTINVNFTMHFVL